MDLYDPELSGLHPEIAEGIAEMADPDGGNVGALAEDARDLMDVSTVMHGRRIGNAARQTRRRLAHIAIRRDARGPNDTSLSRNIDR